MALRGFAIAIGQADFVSSATAMHDLGQLAADSIGRLFRYAKAGVADLVAGNSLQGPVWPTDQTNLAVAADAAIGATTVTVTNGGTNAVTAGQFAKGLLVVETTPGNGYDYIITNNSLAATGGTITLTLADPLQVALTSAASKVSLHENNYNGVIQAPITTLTGAPVGVAHYIIKAGQFGWIGVNGTFATLVKGTPATCSDVIMPGSAAGAVVVAGYATGTTVVGRMRQLGVDGKNKLVQWNLG
jgi:hypothetical protein